MTEKRWVMSPRKRKAFMAAAAAGGGPAAVARVYWELQMRRGNGREEPRWGEASNGREGKVRDPCPERWDPVVSGRGPREPGGGEGRRVWARVGPTRQRGRGGCPTATWAAREATWRDTSRLLEYLFSLPQLFLTLCHSSHAVPLALIASASIHRVLSFPGRRARRIA
jgi:hypothetical protein